MCIYTYIEDESYRNKSWHEKYEYILAIDLTEIYDWYWFKHDTAIYYKHENILSLKLYERNMITYEFKHDFVWI